MFCVSSKLPEIRRCGLGPCGVPEMSEGKAVMEKEREKRKKKEKDLRRREEGDHNQ